ncbi:pre-mRNA-splicing factor ATP-dependent RNA helicase DHX38/PRP16 [Nematocida displodere]|uniref:Pre-mRNA-splicing factor ATP-dependent RNA helicase DHX38/PRP16 n=1 Tax=Nematocida displodere TaxID=1805483 RepID=A0A177EFL7_9MICR|nr:pre-mRNA-splicing factor ATP-dependent RNA helicase DHX38/PRP16 [Nematocida displodere]
MQLPKKLEERGTRKRKREYAYPSAAHSAPIAPATVSPEHKTSSFFGTHLDQQCFGALQTLSIYAKYLLPPPTATTRHNPQTLKHPQTPQAPQAPQNPKYAQLPTEEIVGALQDNRVVMISGGTGTGKTTQIPKVLLKALAPKGLICSTQPRRIAAVSVAKHMQKQLGGSVGYSVRFSEEKAEKIKYVTEGILLREIQHDPSLSSYTVVIIDEVHERTIESQLLLKYVIPLTRTRKDLYCVIMSATITQDLIQEIGLFPIVELPSSTHTVAVEYLPKPTEDYIKSTTDKVLELAGTATGNILVFLTGIEDITVCYNILKQKLSMRLCVLYSKLSLQQQMSILSESAPQCILSTNIAETSITIPNIHYVIDSGMYKEMVYCPDTNTREMVVLPVQRPQAEQRRGRTGRTNSGVCFRMYTEAAYLSFHKSTISKLRTDNPECFILNALHLRIPLPNTPRIKATLAVLIQHRIVEEYSGPLGNLCLRITRIGRKVLQMPLSSVHSLFLLEGLARGCAWEVAGVLGMLDVFGDKYADLLHGMPERVLNRESDHLTLLGIYTAHSKQELQLTAQASPKHAKTLRQRLGQVDKIVQQLCAIAQIPNHPGAGSAKNVISALTASHTLSVAERIGSIYRDRRSGIDSVLSPQSLVFKSGKCPRYVVFNEILTITKTSLTIVTALKEMPNLPPADTSL